jgi:hypothetical protein
VGPSTVVVLSHWPGSPTPEALRADLSAEIAFRALDAPEWLDGARAVSNNHFDQDGLTGVFALWDPSTATQQRELLIDVARAGDFGTFSDRTAARIAMTIAAWAEPARSPLPAEVFAGDDPTAALYEATLPRLGELIAAPEAAEALWAGEDAHLQAGLDAVAAGVVEVDDDPGLDLAVVRIPAQWAEQTAHRFTQARTAALHPMAGYAATERFVVLTLQGGAPPRLECRYETWVRFVSHPVRARRDLRPLAAELDAAEPGATRWRADPPSALTPELRADAPSGLSDAALVERIRTHLAHAPAAWDPAAP